uniref:Uncharacterized protein n=1 Tax=Neogobius melanostomus TaxID=47308 RepID=A0A8C6TAZ5_9GOBI
QRLVLCIWLCSQGSDKQISAADASVRRAQFKHLPDRRTSQTGAYWSRWTFRHALVTLQDGRRFLIHKGPGYGSASDTVITDAAHMSSTWKVTLLYDTENNIGAVTVGDMVRAGGEKYSLWKLQYCHTATGDMIDLC